MSVKEIYQENLKKGKVSTALEDFRTRWKANNAEKVRQEINDRVTTWLTNNQVYVDNYNYRYQGANNKYRNDASDWLSTITTQKSNFDREADNIRNLLNEYKDYFVKDDWAGKVLIALDSGSRQQSKIIEASTKDHEYWSNWDSEEKYKEAIKKYEADEAMKKYDLNAAKVELDDLQAQLDTAKSLESQISNLKTSIRQNENKLTTSVRSENTAMPIVEQLKRQREQLKALESQYKAIDVDSLKNTFSEKSSYYTLASRKQEAVKLASVVNNPDFEEYAFKGMSLKNPSYAELYNDYWQVTDWISNASKLEDKVANKVTFAQSATEDELNLGRKSSIGNYVEYLPFYNHLYKQMKEEEVKIYSYYLAKGDTKSAEKYLDSLTDALTRRQAGAYFDEDYKGNTGMELLFGVAAGIDQAFSGIKNLGNAIKGEEDYITPSVNQYLSGMIREDLADNGFKVFGSSLGQIGYDGITNIANMLPSVLVSAIPVVGQYAGATLLGASAAGNAYADMIKLGYNKDQARGYAMLVGGSEAGLQYLLGGISSLGGVVPGGLTEFAISKVDKTLAKVAIKLGSSIVSEAFEESVQSVLEPWFRSIATDTDFEAPNVEEVLYSGLIGALTSFGLEGGGTAIRAASNAVSNVVGTYKTGKQIKGTEGALQRLKDLGQTFSADTVAYKLAGKVNENTGAYTIGRLFNKVGAEITAQNKADIQKSLTRKGTKESDAAKIADAFADVVAGVKLTEEQAALLEANDVLSKTIIDVLINPNHTINQRRMGYAQVLKGTAEAQADVKAEAQMVAEAVKTAKMDNSSSKVESAKIGRYTASEDGKTRLKDTGEEIEISDVASINDGELILNTKDGKTVEADNVEFSDKDTAFLYESLVDMGVSSVEANLLIHNYDLSESKDGNNELSIFEYAKAISEAYTYGITGQLASDIKSSGMAALLSEKQRKDAHALGWEKRDNAPKEQQELDKQKEETLAKANEEGKKVEKKKGNVYFNGEVVTDETFKGKTKIQQVSVKGLQVIATTLGNNVYLFESYKNKDGKIVFKDAQGIEQEAPNGWYGSNGDIWIDINAGNKMQGAILYTMSHELTHHIQRYSPAKYQKLVNFLIQQYSNNGINFSDEIAKKQKNAKNKKLSYKEAFDEVVADACSTLLLDSNAIAELAKQDKTLWEKIKDFVKGIIDKINKAYKDLDPDAQSAQAVRKLKGVADELSALWLDALQDAGETYSTIAGTTEVNQTEEIKYQLREYTEHQKANWKDSKRIVLYENIEQFNEFINESISNKQYNKKMYFGAIPKDLATLIKSKTGLDVENFNCSLGAYEIRKILKDHGNEQTEALRGQRAITITDIMNIPVVLQSPEKIILSETQYEGKPVIQFTKSINGKLTVAAVVSDKHLDLFVQTAYAGAKKRSLATAIDEQASINTPKATSGTASDKGIVPLSQSDSQQKFSLRENVEETKDLVAVHNLTEEKLLKSLQLGGLPMPSIAIIRAREGHSNFGNISLVFGKETIDPQFFRSNKVYSGDAWTPSYPRVDYKINDKAQEKIRNKINKLVPSEVQTALGRAYLDSDNLTDTMNRHGGNMVTAYKTNYTMKYAYLLDKGNNIELPMTEKELSHFGKHSNKEIIKVAESVSKEDLLKALNGSVDEAYTVEPAIRQAVSEALKEKYPDNPPWLEMLLPKEELPFSELNSYAQEALDYLSKGLQQTVDYKAAKQMIDERVNQGEYEKWIKELFSDIVAKEGIRNNKDIFTPSGNRRSFEALHYEHNLENVIKAMKEEGSKGIGVFGGGSLFGASTTEFSSVEDIKNSAETRLQSLSDDEFSEIKQGFIDRFFELASSLPKHKDSFTATDDAANMLVEAVVKYKTKSGIASYIRRESQGWANYSDYVVDDLIELVKDIQQMPTRYFEAKPERAVGFDEVKAVIIPDNSSAELKTALKEKNFNVLEYQSGNKEERTAVLNSIENVRFSERDSDGNELSKEQQEFFKDSKVRDSKGNLLVVYHGTRKADFTVFKRNINYFTDNKEMAESYAPNNEMYTGYLNIANPYIVDAKGGKWSAIAIDAETKNFLDKYGASTFKEGGKWRTTPADIASAIEEAVDEGELDYDGVIIRNVDDTGGYYKSRDKIVANDYIVFNSKQFKNQDNKAPTSDKDIRYSERDFSEQVDAVLGGADTTSTHLKVMDTPALLQEAGLPNLPVLMTAKHLKSITSSSGRDKVNYHGLDVNIVKKLPEYISDPVMIADSITRNDSIVVITEAVDSENRPVLAAILLNGQGRLDSKHINANIMTSAYGKDNFQSFLNKLADSDSVVFWNKKKSQALSVSLRLQLPNAITSLNSDIIIRKAKAFDKQKNSKSLEKYSERDYEQLEQERKVRRVLEKENEKLKEDNQYLKALVKLQKEVTHGTKMTQTSVDKAAKMLMNDINAKGNRAELVELLNNFYSFIAKGENLAWDSIAVEAKPIVAWLQNHQVTKVEPDPYAQEILSNIRSRRIYLDEQQKAEVASAYGSYNNFRKKTMGRMIIANDSSLSLDSHWQELSSLYPEYFDLETTTNDMPIKMMEIIDVLQDSGSRNMEYEYYEEMMAQDLLMQVYDSYWKVSTLYTVADVKQQEINKLKIKHSQKMQALKEEHKTQDAQLKKDYQERLNKMRLEYRERNAKTQREIMNRYQESRKKAVENRGKTEMRHKIRRVVNELNQLLLKGTKDKHVMDDLQKVVAEALEAVNMDTVGAEQRLNGYTDEQGVYHKGYNQRIAESSDPDTIKELTATRDRIQSQGDSIKERLKALRDAYEQIQTSDDPEIKNSYHDVILDKIKEVVDLVGDTPLRFMNSNQLESVYDMYKMILTAVRTSNKAFKAAKGETITQLAENVHSEVYRVGGEKERRLKVMSYINKFGWEALKPIYAFRTIGSNTLTRIYNNLRKGEDVFYKDAVEGSDFIKSQYEKHGYKDWDVKATKTFKAKSGKSFDLTLEQMMSIYAYSRREQAHDHLIKGGIVFEDAVVEEKKLGLPVKYEVNTKSAFNLSEETLVEIISSLTDKQKAFVEEMQEYLSTTMGAKGNEVSLEMFGVKLFKEKYYFPLKSSQYYMNFKPEEAGEIKLKSPSFSKATVEHANNPVVLSNFTDVWANHVNDMAMYHSFTLPLEDFARVFNYKTKTDANVETISTEATLASAYGNGATEYIRTFLRDLNGGVRVPSTPMDAWFSRAKKGAVMASASVVIQQGSAVMRAMAYVDAKHFVATVGKSLNLFNHKKDWTELKTYAPIAGIKEMGYFDVGMGKSTVSWIKSKDTVRDKIDNALSKAPALADEIAWIQIWQAVKRETMHNNPSLSPRSEEFLKLAGERFTEVVSLTQVYDSVFSRSGMMRNKNGIMKMATAFMAEPTVQLNMLVDMGIQGKRMGGMQGVKFGARVTGSVLSSIVVNAMLKSLITAARDDDEDETYAEKYAEAFTGDMVGNLHPLNLIPVVKDIVSIFNGYDVSRMDMNLFSDLKKAIDDFYKDSKSQAEKWADLAGAISAFFGVPVKNVKRDIMAAINLVSTLTSDNETTKESLMDAIAEGATGKDKSVSTKLYEAIVSGDEEYRARIEKQLAGKNISTYIRQGLRENDPRIKEAAEAHNRGDVDERVRIAKEIIAEGNFKQDDVVAAINSEAIALNKSKSESEATETPKDKVEKTTSLYSANDVITAFESGDTAFAKEIIDDLVAVKVANGSTEKDAKSSLRSSMTSKLKPLYLTADDNVRMEIRFFMRDTGLYGGTSDVISTCRNWLKGE